MSKTVLQGSEAGAIYVTSQPHSNNEVMIFVYIYIYIYKYRLGLLEDVKVIPYRQVDKLSYHMRC